MWLAVSVFFASVSFTQGHPTTRGITVNLVPIVEVPVTRSETRYVTRVQRIATRRKIRIIYCSYPARNIIYAFPWGAARPVSWHYTSRTQCMFRYRTISKSTAEEPVI
jgi:hypothetical protein